MDASRIDGASYPGMNAYFSAIIDIFLGNSYPSNAVFNVNETGFALGTSQSRKVFINKGEAEGFKNISG
jgi:hypothetical protein